MIGGGVITEAIATQVWSGEAAMHFSTVNGVKVAADAGGWGAHAPPRAVSGALAGNREDARAAAPEPPGPVASAGPRSSAGAPKTAREGACAPQYKLTFERGDFLEKGRPG